MNNFMGKNRINVHKNDKYTTSIFEDYNFKNFGLMVHLRDGKTVVYPWVRVRKVEVATTETYVDIVDLYLEGKDD